MRCEFLPRHISTGCARPDLELIGGSGRTAGRYASAARLLRALSYFADRGEHGGEARAN